MDKNVKIIVKPLITKQDAIQVQTIFNHKNIIAYLGGFCHLDSIASKTKQPGIAAWKASIDDRVVGGFVLANRRIKHGAKLGNAGVLPSMQGKKICTCLYAAGLFQCILGGRRLFEIDIIEDNPYQFIALPKLGFKIIGVRPKATASFKDITTFALEASPQSIQIILDRLPQNCSIELIFDSYDKKLWKENITIYEKKNLDFVATITECIKTIKNDSRINIIEEVDNKNMFFDRKNNERQNR